MLTGVKCVSTSDFIQDVSVFLPRTVHGVLVCAHIRM